MFVVLLTTIMTIGISLALASVAMNAALWLVCQARGQQRPAFQARELGVVGMPANVVALQSAAKRLSRAA